MNACCHNRVSIVTVALVLSLVGTACGALIPLPVVQVEAGPSQTVDFQVPMPEGMPTLVALDLRFVTGDLKLAPGAKGYLASGTATFNAVDFEPEVEVTGSSYTLRQGDLMVDGVPKCPNDVKNIWDVQLADTPMNLSIEAGAYNGRFELGGLSLEKLAISEVGSDLTVTFSTPNHVAMSTFTYTTGASRVDLSGLANANFEQMDFQSEAGECTLSFDGDLLRDAQVTVHSDFGTVNITVPEDANAQVTFDGGLTSVNTESGWIQRGDVYVLAGSGPALTILVKMATGTLNLETE